MRFAAKLLLPMLLIIGLAGPISPAVASDPPAAPRMRTVAIDPGHGGPESGAVHRDAAGNVDLLEKEINLDVAMRLARLLEGAGYRVVLTRDTDMALSGLESRDLVPRTIAEQQPRIDIANAAGADIIISIHHNGYGDPRVAGTETYYCPDRPFSDQSQVLARQVLEGIVARLGEAGYTSPVRGVKDDASIGARYGQPHSFLLGTNPGISPTQMPGIFGEALFVSNHKEAALLQRDDILEAEALGYFDGIQAYFAWLDGQQVSWMANR